MWGPERKAVELNGPEHNGLLSPGTAASIPCGCAWYYLLSPNYVWMMDGGLRGCPLLMKH